MRRRLPGSRRSKEVRKTHEDTEADFNVQGWLECSGMVAAWSLMQHLFHMQGADKVCDSAHSTP